jgi:hypothetical protein
MYTATKRRHSTAKNNKQRQIEAGMVLMNRKEQLP